MYYAQNNYPNVKLGTSTDSIKQDGCALVAFSNIVGIDPVTLNQKFIDAGDYANGELIEWANCAKTLGLEWNGISGSALAYPCIAETDHFANLGFPSHFFEVLDANNIVDSLDGQVKPISTYHIVNYYNATPTPQVTTPIMSENDTVVSMLPGLHVGQFRIDGATTVYSVIQVPDPHWETDILKQDWNKIVVLPSDFSADPSTYVAYSQAKLDSANNQIAGLNNQVSTLTTQVNDLNGQVADLQSQLAAAQEAAKTVEATPTDTPVVPVVEQVAASTINIPFAQSVPTSTTTSTTTVGNGNVWYRTMEDEVIKELISLKNNGMTAKQFLGDLIQRLTSRKLWVTIISATYMAVHGDPTQAMAVVMTYLGINAYFGK